MEIRETLYTPAHYLGGRTQRLKFRELSELMTQPPKTDSLEPESKKEKETPKGRWFPVLILVFEQPKNSPAIRGVFICMLRNYRFYTRSD